MIYIIMGVSGSGKTTVGQLLAETLNLPFYDADYFHPIRNVEKMKKGQPLNDDDRRPWLDILATNMTEWNKKGGAVLACSALKKKYRTRLESRSDGSVAFIFLKGSISLITERMKRRTDHYMPVQLLQSQFDALEEPEHALVVDIDQSPPSVVETILKQL